MSSVNREIVFSARDNGVESTISRIKQSASQLSRDIAQEAVNNTSSQKEALRYYEEQVRAIERKARVEEQSARSIAQLRRQEQLSGAKDQGARSKIEDTYKQTMQGISQSSEEDKLQVSLLRELIDVVKSTAREENRSEDKRASVDRAYAAHGSAAAGSAVAGSRGSGGGAGGGPDIAGAMTGAAGSRDMIGAGASALGALGRGLIPVAAAVGGVKVAQSMLEGITNQEMEFADVAALSGTSIGHLYNMNYGDTDRGEYGPRRLNVARTEFRAQMVPESIRARGSAWKYGKDLDGNAYNPYDAALRDLEVSKSMGIDRSTINRFNTLGRGQDIMSSDFIDRLFYNFRPSGAFGKGATNVNFDATMMQELSDAYLNQYQSNYYRSGIKRDIAGMEGYNDPQMAIMAQMRGMGSIYQDTGYLSQSMASLDRGIAFKGTAETDAIKMGLMRQINPNMDFFDMQAQIESGTQNSALLQGMLNLVRSSGGDMNHQKILFDQLTGGSMNKGDIKRIIETGSLDNIETDREMKMVDGEEYRKGGVNYRQRALRASSDLKSKQMWTEEGFEDLKATLSEGIIEGFKYVMDFF